MKLLAIGAHPDDVEIFMSGTLAAAQARGAAIEIAVATDGAAGGKGDPAELRATRKAEAKAAASMLGIVPHFLDFTDGRLVADAALNESLARLFAMVAPDLVLTHAPNDYHGDHRALSAAVRRAAGFSMPVLYADTLLGVGFVPTHYVDISARFALKLAMIRAHVSQDPERFVESATLQNRFRAAQANGRPESYAEAFRFEPMAPFVDIRDLLPPAPPVRPVADRRRK